MNYEKLKYKIFSGKLKIYKLIYSSIEHLIFKYFFKVNNYFDILKDYESISSIEKCKYINNGLGKKKIFFIFRSSQWIEHFIPIALELKSNYSDILQVYFVSFYNMSTRIESISLYKETQNKLLSYNINLNCYFDNIESNNFSNFPIPNSVIFCENMNKFKFLKANRVYLPHYFLLKKSAVDNFRNIKNLDYDTILIPSKKDYFYTEVQINFKKNIKIIKAGYPKLELKINNVVMHNTEHTVIFAPSLDKEVLLKHIEDGIFDVFSKMNNIKFILKLHPSLNYGKSRIIDYIERIVINSSNIVIDKSTSIDRLGLNSNMMICDYGSVGAEYKIMFGKSLIYLNVPKHYEGGSDLLFRDRFSDAICDIDSLESAIYKNINNCIVSSQKIANQCLYNYSKASEIIAKELSKL